MVSTSAQARPDGRQARWDRHNQERRGQILDAALVVIEEGGPGEEHHVQQIASRAGLTRSVVYRHFADRGDLDRAIQAHVIDRLWSELEPALTLEGSVADVIERIVSTYVGWAVAHPALHRVAEQDVSVGDDRPLQRGLAQVADHVATVIRFALDALEADLDDDLRAAIDPLAFALVGMVFGAVRRWIELPQREPSAPVLVALVADSAWFVLDGHLRRLGLEIDPHQPLEELLHLPGAEASP